MNKQELSRRVIFRLVGLLLCIVAGFVGMTKLYHYWAVQEGKALVLQEKKKDLIQTRQHRMLDRSNDPEAIDKEFAQRFEQEVKAAHKLVHYEGDQIRVTHKFGSTRMPKNPQRIVVIRMEDPMIALDIPFVAGNYTEDHYLADELKRRHVDNISVNDDTKTVNYEQVQAENPDLIIMRDSFDQSVYDKLSQIAPTVAFNLRQHEVSLLALSYALGLPDKGETRLREFYERTKFYRLALAERLGHRPVAHLRVLNKEVRIYPYSTNDISRFMYEKLNLTPPQMVLDADFSDSRSAISLEQLPDLNVEYLIISAGYGPTSKENSNIAKARLASMRKDALWQWIPAVREGHVLEVNTSLWNAHGILQEERVMEELYQAWGR